jgi:hypothetical protein
MNSIGRGLLAGAAGTAALNAVTYLDMAVRGRPASSTPEESVERLAGRVGVQLGDGEEGGNRKAGLGALLGYATSAATGVAFALVSRGRIRGPGAVVLLTALAMTGANAPMAALGLSDPRRWSAQDWLSDLVPHLAYGVVAAATYRRLR